MRTLSALVQTALSGATVVARFVVRGYLDSQVWAAADGPDNFSWDNGDGSGALPYTGFGELLQITLPPNDSQSKLNSATLSMSGTDPEVLTSLFSENYRAKDIQIGMLLFNPATGAPGEELLMFDGLGDVASISDGAMKVSDPGTPQTSTLALTVAPRIIDLKRSSGRTGNDADQRLFRDVSDGFFQDTAMVSLSAINWGISGPASPVNIALNSTTVNAPNGTFVVPNLFNL